METENKTHLEISQKNLDPLAFFKEEGEFAFVYKKTEKLASAVYMVTNFFDLNEPLKWTLRKKVGDMIPFVLEYKDTFSGRKADFLYQAKSNILELVSLLEISFRAGLVSQMNFSIIKQEFLNLISTLESSVSLGKESSQGSIPGSFFDTAHYADTSKGEPKEKPKMLQSVRNPLPERHVEKRSNRQTVILELLQKRGELTIKDISIIIKDCSEKTIQRELASFIFAGLVKRKGERRWSKYSLA